MYEIEMQEMSSEFFRCWQVAGKHLNLQVKGGIQSWLRAHPYPPFLEHLSFRLGNQLFFVRIEDVDGRVIGPGSVKGLRAAARDGRGHACLLPMKRELPSGAWRPDRSGWGLLDVETGEPIDPISLVTDERIAMTSWELQDMAVQVVRDHLDRMGYRLTSWQGNPKVDPAIWFIGESGGPEWVVVRHVIFPSNRAPRPGNWDAIASRCAAISRRGHFASVGIVSAAQPFRSEGEEPVPLWRGEGMHVMFTGLE